MAFHRLALCVLALSAAFVASSPVVVQTDDLSAPRAPLDAQPAARKHFSLQDADSIKRFVCELNKERASRSLAPLGYDSRLDTFAQHLAKNFGENHSIFRQDDEQPEYDVKSALKSAQIHYGVVRSHVTFQCFHPRGCVKAFLSETGRASFLDTAVTKIGVGSFEDSEELYVGTVLIGDGKHARNVPVCDA